MNSSSYQLEQLHSKLLIMYKELKELFDNNNIRYFGIGGTGIGAVREKGFIRWDDDLDLAVFEEDIPKLIKVLENSKYSVKNNRLPYNPFPFYKIYDNSTLIAERGEIIPLNIDIFIAARKRMWTNKTWRRQEYLKFVLYAKSRRLRNFDFKTTIGRFIGFWIMGRLLFWASFKKKSSELISLMPSIAIDDSVSSNIRHCYHVSQKESYDVSEFVTLKFEDTNIPVNKTFAKDMAWRYGDITIKPTEEHIYNHKVYLIKENQD